MTMQPNLSENPVVQWLIRWGEAHDDMRALILTSTLTNPSAYVDIFSDYDIFIAVNDIQPYLDHEAWLDDFGRVLVKYRDPVQHDHGFPLFARITQYEDGTKIDYIFVPIGLLEAIVAEPVLRDDFDVGYQVLLDKDGITANLKPPTYQAYIPRPPDEKEYLRVIDEFFHGGTYVVKHLYRGDLMPLKYLLDYFLKQDTLRLMLEWHYEIENGWLLKTGAHGKWLHKRLRPDLYAELEATYCGADPQENWQAFYRTIELFRKVAKEVGRNLGLPYPEEMDKRCMSYYTRIEGLTFNNRL
jgi:aminoglycoside 6-adenylyltransferase